MLVVDLTHSEIKCIFSEILFVLGGIEECKKKVGFRSRSAA